MQAIRPRVSGSCEDLHWNARSGIFRFVRRRRIVPLRINPDVQFILEIGICVTFVELLILGMAGL